MSGWIPKVLSPMAASRAPMHRMTPSEKADLRERRAGQPDPIVPAYWSMSSPLHLVFWCPWCNRVHSHGAGGGDGHRVSHCHEKTSPLFGEGYELLYAGTVVNEAFAPQYSEVHMVRIWDALVRCRCDHKP
jgi:hypothetical protein